MIGNVELREKKKLNFWFCCGKQFLIAEKIIQNRGNFIAACFTSWLTSILFLSSANKMIENANKNNERDLMVAKIEIKKKELLIAKLESELELKTKENLELNQFLDTLKWMARLTQNLNREKLDGELGGREL